MILEAFKAVAGLALLLGGWYAVQALVRKRPGQDSLEHLKHGCHGCHSEGSCGGSHSCTH